MTRLIANNFSTTLNGAITDVATSMTLTSVTGFPAVGGGDTCQVTLDDGAGNIEIVTATAIAGSVITITRAQEGTSGFAFADLDPVEIRDTALLYTDVLASDLTPVLQGPLDASGTYIGFGGSSTSTAYCINHAGNIPKLIGAANYYWGFTTSSNIYAQAGTSWNNITFTNDSTRFKLTTNNSERLSVNDSGLQLGASGARVTTILDEDAMGSDSATALATQQSIKAYVDGAGGGISNVVEDTTPQLGGTLDANTYNIDFDNNTGIRDSNSNEQIRFIQTTSAVNHLDVTNAATGNAVKISTAGGDANIDLDIDLSGSGGLKINGSTAKIDTILDEDDLTSDDATALATQQSIKAYVDAVGGTFKGFKARRTTIQTITTNTSTKIQLATEDFDTEGDFDNTTNYRHTPSVAGKWLYSYKCSATSLADGKAIVAAIQRNGTDADVIALTPGAASTQVTGATVILDMNGTTDYVELYIFHRHGSDRDVEIAAGHQPTLQGTFLGV